MTDKEARDHGGTTPTSLVRSRPNPWPRRLWGGVGAVLTAVLLAAAVQPSLHGVIQMTWLSGGGPERVEQHIEGPMDQIWYAGDAPQVRIHGTDRDDLRIREELLRVPRDPMTSAQVQHGALAVKTTCAGQCATLQSQELSMPQDRDLRVVSAEGGIFELLGVDGDVDAWISGGIVNLGGLTGDVEARSVNAEIFGRSLSGEQVSVRTTIGQVNLHHSELPQRLDAQSQRGDITIVLPEGTLERDCTVEAETNGDVAVDLPAESAESMDESPREADCRLSLTSESGDITVKAGDELPAGADGRGMPG